MSSFSEPTASSGSSLVTSSYVKKPCWRPFRIRSLSSFNSVLNVVTSVPPANSISRSTSRGINEFKFFATGQRFHYRVVAGVQRLWVGGGKSWFLSSRLAHRSITVLRFPFHEKPNTRTLLRFFVALDLLLFGKQFH